MTQNSAKDRLKDLPAEEKAQVSADSVDVLLSSLVTIANRSQLRTRVTLFVNGIIVAGTIVSGSDFFAKTPEQFHGMYPDRTDGMVELVETLFKEIGDALYPQNVEEDDGIPVDTIHLLDAHIYNIGNQAEPIKRLVFWRGKLSSVDGWYFGDPKDI